MSKKCSICNNTFYSSIEWEDVCPICKNILKQKSDEIEIEKIERKINTNN
jgi:rubrerythrin